MTDENQEYAIVEAELDNLTKVTLKIPKKLDIANLSGLLFRLQKLIKVFPAQPFNNSGKRSYVKHYQIDTQISERRQRQSRKYPFSNSKAEFDTFYKNYKSVDKEQRKQLAEKYNVSLHKLRNIIAYYKKIYNLQEQTAKEQNEVIRRLGGVGKGHKSKFPFLKDRNLAIEFIAKFRNTAFNKQARAELCKPYTENIDLLQKHLCYVKNKLNINNEEIQIAKAKLK